MNARTHHGEHAFSAVEAELAKLPGLPQSLVYFDDYAGERRSIESPAAQHVWRLQADGKDTPLDFSAFPGPARDLLKHWAAWALTRKTPATLRIYQAANMRVLEKHGPDLFTLALHAHPHELRDSWHSTVLPAHTHPLELVGLKSLFHFVAAMGLGQFRPEHADFIGTLRLPKRDKYAKIRTGEVFLSITEEGRIVEYLDSVIAQVSAGSGDVPPDDIRDACVLALSYEHAFRPSQIAKLRRSDVRTYRSEDEQVLSVHATFWAAKQRWNSTPRPLARAIKRDWVPLFTNFIRVRDARPGSFTSSDGRLVPDSFFGLSPDDVTKLIRSKTAELLGPARCANVLRHTGAQRMADAGASQEELAEFLGQSSLESGLVYYESSPAQAALLNNALAVSPVYQTIAEVARTRTIDKAALLGLPTNNQVQGCPHGIEIAGIGACELGQSLCAKNPVIACYTCRKFMPVTDCSIHREVLNSLRPIVRLFYGASREESQGAAYMQLSRALEAVQAVVVSLEAEAGSR